MTESESREQIIGYTRRAREHADVLVHVLNDTTRHTGHADILREQLDGRTGVAAGHTEQLDTAAREAHCAKIERAARAAQSARA